MPAFAWMSQFREGQWRSFRRFLLEERRDATSRFMVIEAEKNRIGDVQILYAKKGDGTISERRVGISVTPQESNLGKLFSAYVALGGNPFDISMFIAPDRSVSVNGTPTPTMPGGGVAHPNDIKYAYDQGVGDGDTNLLKYKGSRMGGKKISVKEFEILGIMSRARKWVSSEIRYKRTLLEERIIKQCDLREQLDEELEDLIWATYGDMAADIGYDPDRYNKSLSVASIVYFFDSSFRKADLTDVTRIPVDNEAGEGKPGSVNMDVLSGFTSLMSDEDEEDNSGL